MPPASMVPREMLSLHVNTGASGGGGGGGVGLLGLLQPAVIDRTVRVQNSKRRNTPRPGTTCIWEVIDCTRLPLEGFPATSAGIRNSRA